MSFQDQNKASFFFLRSDVSNTTQLPYISSTQEERVSKELIPLAAAILVANEQMSSDKRNNSNSNDTDSLKSFSSWLCFDEEEEKKKDSNEPISYQDKKE
ncbi:hypothetical protein RMCBS344292_10779 [Rhizopus microsporus]|nr:hypothetical protein RMCBS344292_10779 [Rhizopus microsporus]